jgi:hypothetical protein
MRVHAKFLPGLDVDVEATACVSAVDDSKTNR